MEPAVTALDMRHRFTVDEYTAMARHRIIPPDARTELLDGEVVEMTPIGWLHQSVVTRLTDFFARQCGSRAWVWVQGPFALSPWSLPQPDVVLLERRADAFAEAGPGPEDALLLIEVADTSLAVDRQRKLPLYAAAGVAAVWVVDLRERCIHQFSAPIDGIYTKEHVADPTGSIEAPCADTPVPVRALIG
jgi:Uma2 family endonuclease